MSRRRTPTLTLIEGGRAGEWDGIQHAVCTHCGESLDPRNPRRFARYHSHGLPCRRRRVLFKVGSGPRRS